MATFKVSWYLLYGYLALGGFTRASPVSSGVPAITLEEHFLDAVFEPQLVAANQTSEWIVDKLIAPSTFRIQQMDEAGIAKQVISHAPVNGNVTACQQANNDLHAIVQKNTDRFAGWCLLPVSQPAAAGEELARCVTELGFVGAMIPNHDNGRFYDNETYWPMFSQAVKLNVPIYLHPVGPTPAMVQDEYSGSYNKVTANLLGTQGWGWHELTGLHFLRLFASGVFDTFPSLKLIMGHMGEMVPFQLDRIIAVAEPSWEPRIRNLRTVWDDNIWVTTSGFFTLPAFRCLIAQKSTDKIMYSVDWPWGNNTDGQHFLQTLAGSGIVSKGGFEDISYRNAMALLNLTL
ncbi:hypothetical protein NQ176_g1329 [Zarea fungicola]|uniref:Uncharacterized protein n=1 Tax=Zarea fungicola TaxID=93591 RepID=A0ACC1NVE4_9HYPO|nr:hypothetical protein NQ176_g1329 [Lecanicillium fungicola]